MKPQQSWLAIALLILVAGAGSLGCDSRRSNMQSVPDAGPDAAAATARLETAEARLLLARSTWEEDHPLALQAMMNGDWEEVQARYSKIVEQLEGIPELAEQLTAAKLGLAAALTGLGDQPKAMTLLAGMKDVDFEKIPDTSFEDFDVMLQIIRDGQRTARLSREKARAEAAVATRREQARAEAAAATRTTQLSNRARPEADVIWADMLASAYEGNEIAADARFKGKTISVRGTVQTVILDFSGTPNVLLNTSGLRGVAAEFRKRDAAKLSSLRAGQMVIVRCRCDGMFGNVNLSRCELLD
jgi:hypothetical protein